MAGSSTEKLLSWRKQELLNALIWMTKYKWEVKYHGVAVMLINLLYHPNRVKRKEGEDAC